MVRCNANWIASEGKAEMQVYDLRDSEGRIFAFEVSVYIGRPLACRIAATIPDCHVTRKPKNLSWLREDEFCEFEIDGVRFVMSEAFGDSNRFWIGPEPPGWTPQIEKVRDAFMRTGFQDLVRLLIQNRGKPL